MSSTPMENFIITDFSLETLLAQQLPGVPSISSDYGSLTSAALACDSPTAIPAARTATANDEHVSIETKKKRKAMEQSTCKSQIISPAVSAAEVEGNTNTRKNNRLCRVKKAKEAEEIIYVRARRGQATDSHSLAERVRREKINEKMRCLQDIVPGCHKTMGMAVMLEEITNYVHSLQNQVELAAASSYDLNFETQGIKNAQDDREQIGVVKMSGCEWQEGTNSQVVQQQQQNEKWAIDRYGEQHWFHSTWPPL